MSHRHGIKKNINCCLNRFTRLLVGFPLEKNQVFTQACANLSWHWSCGRSRSSFYNCKILSFFVLFPSDLFGVDAGMIFCYHLFWCAWHPCALNHALWCNFLRRPCCPANFFLRSSRGMPTAPPEDAPACVQCLNARALRCLQRFHEKHSQHMLSSEARINVIPLNVHHLNCTLHCSLMKPSQNGIEHKVSQNSAQEGASAPMLQVEQKSSPSGAEFALEGQDTLGQDCSPEVCRCTLVSMFKV